MLADHDGNTLAPMGPERAAALSPCQNAKMNGCWRERSSRTASAFVMRYRQVLASARMTIAAEADCDRQFPVTLRALRSRSQLTRDRRNALGRTGRSQVETGPRPGRSSIDASPGITRSEQRHQRLGDALGDDRVLHELSRDFASRDDVHQSDVRNLHHASRDSVRPRARLVRDGQRTTRDRCFERRRATLA